jgi:hypothetical protein
MAWLFREPLMTYRLHSDDFEYLSAARSFDRLMANLFRAHNTHIVPAWRVLCWLAMRVAGRLANLQPVLASFAFLTLIVVALATRKLVSRETGRSWMGMAALIALGTTSVVKSSATWFSSGQTLWAALFILTMLLSLQAWRIRGGWHRLLFAALAAWTAGAFWTIGHAAGPVGAIYLWCDGRRRSRALACVPLFATFVSIAIALVCGGRFINAKISFHGRSEREAVNMISGASHTLQAIPENLLIQNLGIECETSEQQGLLLSCALLSVWIWSWTRWGRPRSLECAGALLVTSAYLVEWSFRGYLPFSSLRGIVPWYDTIPHVGAVLAGFGALDRVLGGVSRPVSSRSILRLRGAEALGLLAFQLLLLVLHTPRVEALFIGDVPKMTHTEARVFLTHDLRLFRARYLAGEFARLQRLDLARLDRVSDIGHRLGIGRDAIGQAIGRVDLLELPDVYDGLGLLDLPAVGEHKEPNQIRQTLGPLLQASTPPRIPDAMLRAP